MLTIRDSNVSSEAVVRWPVKPEKLQCSYAMIKALNKLTGLGILETQCVNCSISGSLVL